MTIESKGPVLDEFHKHTTVGPTTHQHWWPNQLYLKVLQQDSPQSDPPGQKLYHSLPGFVRTHREAIEAEIQLMTNWVRSGHERYHTWSVLHSVDSLAMDHQKTLATASHP